MHQVTSSAIRSLGYNQQTRTLQIEFTSGAVYEYPNVPWSLYEAFDRAESKGTFFDAYIRNAGFDYRLLRSA